MSFPLQRLNRALADRYRIERELGVGGMATVYLAHDLRHDRDVAIKVLHPDLGVALGSERFLSEIRTTARLQHPHILPLLDSGEVDGLLYYVMPLVTGETLRTRLERERLLPIPDAVRITREVASALDYAHRQGVIHRDIKPENILLHDGQALVADFGIALAVQTAGGARMTQTGLSLGTPQYMSPEQAMGEKVIDARSDIYSLGAVTYEMLTGEPPFTGPSVQAIVAKALSERPVPPSIVRDTIPPHVEQAVLAALAKLPADRFATAAEYSAALGERGAASSSSTTFTPQAPAVRRARWRDPFVLGLGALSLALAVMAGLLVARVGARGEPFPYRFLLDMEAEDRIGPAALSLDGHTIVYSARSASSDRRVLWVRRLDQLSAHELAGTGVPYGRPAFSPDGQWVAFIANRRKLMKVPLDGGPAVTLGDVIDYGGLDWSPRGEIVIGAGIDEGGDGLTRVNAAGGPMTPLTRVDKGRKELSHQQPRILADGKTVLFTIWSGTVRDAQIAATSLDDGKVRPLGVAGVTALDVVDGQLLYLSSDGKVMAVAFDVRALRATGAPIPVQDSVRFQGGGGSDHVEAFVTHAGGFVYWRGNANRRLVWVDRSGVSRPAIDAQHEYEFVRLSPDGRHAASTIVTGARYDIWTVDLSSGTISPLSSTGTVRNPTWSPDGARLLYVSTQGGRAQMWWHPADGSGPPVLAGDPKRNAWMLDLAPDGRTTVFNVITDGTFNLETFALGGSGGTRVLADSRQAWEVTGRFSPDARWVAYQSDESGRGEIYLRSLAEGGGRVQVSANGGARPVWAHDGREIFYWEDRRLVAARLAFDPAPHVVSRTPLFDGSAFITEFDVSPDGRRFVMIERASTGLSLVVVPEWRTELRRLTKGK